MIDTDTLEKSGALVLSNIILMLIVTCCFWDAKKIPYKIYCVEKKNIGIVCLFLFFIFAFWGADWFHMANFYPLLQSGHRTHMEDLYVWIAQNIAPNYLVFRSIIWGSCLLLLKLLFDRIDVKKDLLWLMFVVFGAVWCSYARVSLAMCLMFYGFATLFKPYKYKLLSYFIGILAIWGAYYCHKTALFGIVIVILATIIRKFNKYSFILLILFVPFVLILLQDFVSNIQFIDTKDVDSEWGQSMSSAQRYMDRDATNVGIGALMLKILERSAYILTGIESLLVTIKNKSLGSSPIINAFLRLEIFMLFFSCLFLLDLGIDTSIIAERFFRFLFIPTGILIAYFWQIRYRMKLTKICFILAILYSSYSLLYSLYMFR